MHYRYTNNLPMGQKNMLWYLLFVTIQENPIDSIDGSLTGT